MAQRRAYFFSYVPYSKVKAAAKQKQTKAKKFSLQLSNLSISLGIIFIPNRTFLVRFGGISGEFGRAMVRILARRSRAKIPMARPNEPDMPPKRTKKVRLGIYRTQIQPKIR